MQGRQAVDGGAALMCREEYSRRGSARGYALVRGINNEHIAIAEPDCVGWLAKGESNVGRGRNPWFTG